MMAITSVIALSYNALAARPRLSEPPAIVCSSDRNNHAKHPGIDCQWQSRYRISEDGTYRRGVRP